MLGMDDGWCGEVGAGVGDGDGMGRVVGGEG